MVNRLGDVPGVVTIVGNEKVQECGPVRSCLATLYGIVGSFISL